MAKAQTDDLAELTGFAEPENPFELFDGRQSPTAAAVQRGTCRLLAQMGYAAVTELPLATGRRIDVMGLGQKGELLAIEIKSSLADFRADQKWPGYLSFCDRFFFAVPADFPREVLPAEVGLIVADRYGAEVLRDAPTDKLVGARRKAVTLLFARVAARRLYGAIEGLGPPPAEDAP